MSTISSSSSTSSAVGSFNFDGLASGLNTTEIVSQLMTIEARPQTLLKSRKEGFEQEVSAFGSIRSTLVALKTAASAASNLVGWEPVSAKASSDAVTVSSTSAQATGSITFRVDSLARAHTLASTGTVADLTTTSVTGGASSLTVGVGGESRSIAVGGGTLQEVVDAINGQADFGVTASAVKVADGAYRLQLISTEAGSANAISFDAAQLPGAGGAWLTVAAASDAQITVGTMPNGYTVTSTTNAISDLLPGLTVNLQREGETVTVTSSRDSGKLADQVSSMVDALNASLAEITKQTKYDAATRKSSPLTGHSTVRQVQQLLAEALTGNADSTPSAVGITLGRDGKVTFDRATFLEAYTRDPSATEALFTPGDPPGVAARLVEVVDRTINATDGLLTSAQGAATKVVSDLAGQIEAYQVRLDKRQETLRKQFTALETALNSMSSQASWLAGQLGNLL